MKNGYKFDDAVVQDFFDNHYRDRGLVKWQGYYLSDHTSALNKESAVRNRKIKIRPQQSLAAITVALEQSFSRKKVVTLQLNVADVDTEKIAEYSGIVQGYLQDMIYLEDQIVALNSIRNVYS